jgi:hypothetical protein
MQIVFVEEYEGDCKGEQGSFLADLTGDSKEEFLKNHKFLSLLDPSEDKSWFLSFKEIADSVTRIYPQLTDKIVIFLGKNVAKAFGAERFNYLQRYELYGPAIGHITHSLYILPHPKSGRSLWAIRKNRDAAKLFFAKLLKKEIA